MYKRTNIEIDLELVKEVMEKYQLTHIAGVASKNP